MINTIERTNASAVTAKPAERRGNPRYNFVADIELFDPKSGIAWHEHTADFSRGGCYVDTFSPLRQGAEVKLRITKSHRTFEARAKVVHSAVGVGMGLQFVAIIPEQRCILEGWVDELGSQQSREVDG